MAGPRGCNHARLPMPFDAECRPPSPPSQRQPGHTIFPRLEVCPARSRGTRFSPGPGSGPASSRRRRPSHALVDLDKPTPSNRVKWTFAERQVACCLRARESASAVATRETPPISSERKPSRGARCWHRPTANKRPLLQLGSCAMTPSAPSATAFVAGRSSRPQRGPPPGGDDRMRSQASGDLRRDNNRDNIHCVHHVQSVHRTSQFERSRHPWKHLHDPCKVEGLVD
jgi:hypothetical protein